MQENPRVNYRIYCYEIENYTAFLYKLVWFFGIIHMDDLSLFRIRLASEKGCDNISLSKKEEFIICKLV